MKEDNTMAVVYDREKTMADGSTCQMVIYEDVSTKDYYPRVMHGDSYLYPKSRPNNSFGSYAEALQWVKDSVIRLTVETKDKQEQRTERSGGMHR